MARPPAVRIVAAAIRFRGVVYSLPAPARHHDVMWHIMRETGAETVDAHGDDQGFVDSLGRYLRRTQALHVAVRADQIKPGTVIRCNQLFSEDVW